MTENGVLLLNALLHTTSPHQSRKPICSRTFAEKIPAAISIYALPNVLNAPDNISAHVYQLYSIVFIDGIINVSKEVLDLQQSRAQPSGQLGVPPEEGRAFIQSVAYIPFYDIRLKTLIGVIIHEGTGI